MNTLRHRFRLAVSVVSGIVQLPAVLWLTWFTHTPLPLAAAVAISFPYLRELRTPWASESRRATAYVALAWWLTCLSFALLLPFAMVTVWLGVSPSVVFAIVWALSVLGGLSAVSGRPRVNRRVISIEDLPTGLEGYRIGQLSDIHCGPNTPASRVRGWVERMNALDLDLVTVTGDLITSGDTHVAAVAEALGHLRARDGVYACMGNHDYFTDGERMVRELERAGVTVLRNRGVVVAHDGAELFVAGVDDTWTRRNDVQRALRDRPKKAVSLLLAHDPALFPEAVAHGVDLTLSGHTHGGQLAVPGVRRWSLARLMSEFTWGLYRRGRSTLYVNRGAGTTGPPVRFGAPAELAVLFLTRAE